MAEADRARWDERYSDGGYAARDWPTALLAEWEPRLPRGRALDVACGAGRNSLFLAAAGRAVDAVDISPVGLARAREKALDRSLSIEWIEADLDLEPPPLPAGPYALVVLVRFVKPSLLPQLFARLAPGGVLLCEEHVESTADVIGPRTAQYRLRENELLRDVQRAGGEDCRILYYREGLVTDPDGRLAALAQVIARKGAAVEGDEGEDA